jgi:hypothetical protein
MFTMGSQPELHQLPSDNCLFGWGGPEGQINQRAYGIILILN